MPMGSMFTDEDDFRPLYAVKRNTSYYQCCVHCSDGLHDEPIDGHPRPCDVSKCIQGKKVSP